MRRVKGEKRTLGGGGIPVVIIVQEACVSISSQLPPLGDSDLPGRRKEEKAEEWAVVLAGCTAEQRRRLLC
jgi:hypothetical protein